MTASPSTSTSALTDQLRTLALQLPGVSGAALKVMRLADDPRATGAALEAMIETDPVLCARLLRVASSSFYGARQPMSSIGAAIRTMGFSAVKNVALAASLTRAFRGGADLIGFDAPGLWTHSLAVAVGARHIATHGKRVDPGEAFVAGALHDIGVAVALHLSRNEFRSTVLAVHENPALTFRDAERHHLGATHETLGEALCEGWKFPTALRQACGHHHDPESADASARSIVAIVHAADVIAATAGLGYHRTVETLELSEEICESAGLSTNHLQELRRELPERVAAAAQAFGR